MVTHFLIKTAFDKILHFGFYSAEICASIGTLSMQSKSLDMGEFYVMGAFSYSFCGHHQEGLHPILSAALI